MQIRIYKGDELTKAVKRSEIVGFLNTTPSSASEKWDLFGNGVTSASYAYNPQNTTETWIVNDNATTTLDSYQFAIDGEQSCLFGDPVYDFINKLRYDMAVGDDAKSQVLLVDKYDYDDEGGTTKYKAQKFDCVISINEYGGDGGATPKISYNIAVNGDPINGSVTISNGVPTFAEE